MFAGADLPIPDGRLRSLWRRLLGLSAVAVTGAYLVWRAVATLGGASPWLAVPLLVLEVWALLSLLLYLMSLWDVDAVAAPRPVRDTRLRVAVLIPTYNEPYEVLLPTVAAAVAMRVPHETWVLDDGRRPWVAELATQLGARYVARVGNEHAKAGNINALLPTLDVDLITVFDADHVARADFLEHTVGYFDDPRMALVQTPQDFYNVDSFEHVHRRGGKRFSEQELFYRALSAGRNRWNAAFWCGTNAVVRLAALREVGGVATDTVTEDIHTTIRLHRRGWRTVYHNEVLARGLAAGTAEQYLSQRQRWGTGAMQVLRRERPAGLTLAQCLSYLATLLGWFDSWRTLGYILLPVATVASGLLPVSAPALEFLTWFTVVYCVQRLALAAFARGRATQTHATLFEFVRLPANLNATLALFSGRAHAFTVTAKGRQSGDTRTRTATPRLLIGLLATSAVAAAWYVATVAGFTPLTYHTPWVAHGVMIWLVVNAAILVAAIHRIRLERFGTERRAAVRFDHPGIAHLNGTRYTLRDVSLTGASVTGDTSSARPGQRVHLRLDLPATALVVPATVRLVTRGGWPTLGLEFDGITPAQQARLALALFGTGLTPTLTPEPAAAISATPL
ncbi:glycosyltransferase [Actinophytocola sp.]|uniref:glycosyltransferase n=1 Tax=Actinophytocola sp. TaxID=1872138 RepID=UPI002ED5FD4A